MFSREYIDLMKCLLGEIGLAVNSSNEIYDQDTFNPILYNGKVLVFTYKPDTPIFVGNNQCLFDPFNDTRMIAHLFDYYLSKEQLAGNLVVDTFFITELDDKRKFMTIADRYDGTIESRPFYNPSLQYIDIILKLGFPMEYAAGQFNWLYEFEIDPKTLEEKGRRRR